MSFSGKIPKFLLLLLLVGGAFFVGSQYFGEDQEVSPVELKIPVLSATAEQGKTLYDANCASCHGANAAGTENGPTFIHGIYKPNLHADLAFVLAAVRGVRAHHWRFGNMPAVPGVSEQEVALIVEYVRTIQKANGVF